MIYKLYKLSFSTGIHIGKRNLSDAEMSMSADTLFSAMCQEYLKKSKNDFEAFIEKAKCGKIRISDVLPYIKDNYYIPKPMMKVDVAGNKGDSSIKKAYKKLAYIPCDKLEQYMRGELDIKYEQDCFYNDIGEASIRTCVSIHQEQETLPYRIGTYYFRENSGLYVLAGVENYEDIKELDECFTALGLTGIGGKRKSGLGRFTWTEGTIPENFKIRFEAEGKRYMSLSCCLPDESEIEEALEDSQYMLVKRSGFVASEQYSDKMKKKKDFYVLQAGSCFSKKFDGCIADVSDGGNHAVYRYAKPFFVEVIS